jgi:glycosyltransferase involved in cell wall biosynthesis
MPSAAGRPGLVRYVGLFSDLWGYETEARIVVDYLRRAGYNLVVVPVGGAARRAASPRFTGPSVHPPVGPSVEVLHLPPLLFEVTAGAASGWKAVSGTGGRHPRVARTMTETAVLPRSWARACRSLDELWVPSRFNLTAFARAGLPEERLRVVPVGVDTTLFRPGRADGGALPWRPGGADSRRFKFLSVFAWQARKGWDILLRAYLREFTAADGVLLVLKTRPFGLSEKEQRRQLARVVAEETACRRAGAAPPVRLLTARLTVAEMARLYSACDAFVLPSRGEGFGRPYLEAMASGLPTIGTGWGGNLDFMTRENSYLIEVEGLEPAAGDPMARLYEGEHWARPSLEDLRRLMRRVVERPDEAAERARKAREDSAAWSVAATCGRLARELDRFIRRVTAS